jgi:predicted alpha/beta hydrolase family esterase
MQKRVFIIHGWGNYPEEGWMEWMRSELVKRGFLVAIPPMPDTDCPSMKLWLSYMKDVVGHSDEHTYFIGHSLGCQAILRYLQYQLPAVKLGGALFVAGFETLGARNAEPEVDRCIGEWLKEPIHWEAIRGRSRKFTAIFSDNDPWVPLSNVKVFDEKLYAHTIVLHNRDHFSPVVVKEFPEALDALLEMSE